MYFQVWEQELLIVDIYLHHDTKIHSLILWKVMQAENAD